MSLSEHCLKREKHEQETHKLFERFLKRKLKNFKIEYPSNEWSYFDVKVICGEKETKCELKVRNCTVDYYSTIALSKNKVIGEKTSDMFFIFYPISRKVLITTRKAILDNLDKVEEVDLEVTRYQYSSEQIKHKHKNLLIPISVFKFYDI